MLTITSPITGATSTLTEAQARAGLAHARKEIAQYERELVNVQSERDAKARTDRISATLGKLRAMEQVLAAALGE